MKQLAHKKLPFYSASTRHFSYKVFSIAPFADALHEQDMVKVKEATLYCGNEEVENAGNNPPVSDPLEELQRAKNHSFWNTETCEKQPDYKGSLEVSHGEGRATREVELIWWPDLFSEASNQGKLTVSFFLKKVNL